VPIILVALVAGAFLVPKSRDPEEAALRSGRRGLVDRGNRSRSCTALIEAPSNGWTSHRDVGVVRGWAAVVLALFVAWELRVTEPMLDMHYFKKPRVQQPVPVG